MRAWRSGNISKGMRTGQNKTLEEFPGDRLAGSAYSIRLKTGRKKPCRYWITGHKDVLNKRADGP